MDGRTYAVIASYLAGKEPRVVTPPDGHLFIRGEAWPLGATPTPLRWPPFHRIITWQGETALLHSVIQ